MIVFFFRCYVSGWGKNAFTGSYQSVLKEVDVPIVDSTNCENQLKQTRLGAAFILDRNSFICAGGEQGKDACTVKLIGFNEQSNMFQQKMIFFPPKIPGRWWCTFGMPKQCRSLASSRSGILGYWMCC